MASSIFALVVWILLAACASVPPGEEGGAEVQARVEEVGERRGEEPVDLAEVRFFQARRALTADRFEEAYWELHALAGRCESGEWGRRAVLLLAAQALEPGNPARFPDAGARLAARYLQEPGRSAASDALARSLYVHALELGAAPVEDPFAPIPIRDPATGRDGRTDREATVRAEVAGSWRTAPRFHDCAAEAPGTMVRDLPDPPEETLHGELGRLSTARDSLTARVDSLQSELDRVRGLLRSGSAQSDTTPDRP